MRVLKILNNNAFISQDENNEEIVVMGRGIGFQRKVNDEIQMSEGMKIFSNKDNGLNEKLKEVISNIPENYIEITEKIVNILKEKYNKELHNIIYVSLTEHIHSAVERFKNGIEIKNPLLNEIKRLYKDEYDVSLEALEIIRKELGIAFTKDEAGYITNHIINAQLDGSMNNTAEITRIAQKILNIIEYNMLITINEETMSYYRIVTHLKFLALRMINGTVNDEDDELFEILKVKYPKCYKCVSIIDEFSKTNYDYELTNAEQMYLIIYIQRLCKESTK